MESSLKLELGLPRASSPNNSQEEETQADEGELTGGQQQGYQDFIDLSCRRREIMLCSEVPQSYYTGEIANYYSVCVIILGLPKTQPV